MELPDADAPPIKLPKDFEMLIISVKEDGSYFMNLGDSPKKAKPLAEITEAVGKIKKNKPETPVLVEGDERVPYGVVVRLMVALQRSGINDVGLVTDTPDQEL